MPVLAFKFVQMFKLKASTTEKQARQVLQFDEFLFPDL